MSDLIDRRTAIDAADKIIERDTSGSNAVVNAMIAWSEYIKALPPAQPEIIHCKDCKYNPNPPECGNAACVLFYGMTDQMGFCHHGERRERE